jgi:ubiquinone/menaquinone biosynthesis C-methylase UbiE
VTALAKPYKGPAMEGAIASWYARITKRDRGYAAIADEIAASLPRGARVLEVAPGPGYLAIELARRGLRVSAIDISASFVRIARDNAAAAGVELDVRRGNASELPYADGSFDHLVCRAAFKNFTDPLGALDEAHRVLAPGGRAAIHDLRKEASKAEIAAEIRAMQLSWISAWWTRLTFRWFLLRNAYSEPALTEMVAKCRFGKGVIDREGIGFVLRLTR